MTIKSQLVYTTIKMSVHCLVSAHVGLPGLFSVTCPVLTKLGLTQTQQKQKRQIEENVKTTLSFSGLKLKL